MYEGKIMLYFWLIPVLLVLLLVGWMMLSGMRTRVGEDRDDLDDND